MNVDMHGAVLTSVFERQAKRAGLDETALMEIVAALAENPLGGELIIGTGGARKMRHAGRGKGKSGGYRTIHYFGGQDVPLFLLAIYGKDQKSNLSAAERRELALILPRIADAYRKGK
jgi:hypothetical protein